MLNNVLKYEGHAELVLGDQLIPCQIDDLAPCSPEITNMDDPDRRELASHLVRESLPHLGKASPIENWYSPLPDRSRSSGLVITTQLLPRCISRALNSTPQYLPHL